MKKYNLLIYILFALFEIQIYPKIAFAQGGLNQLQNLINNGENFLYHAGNAVNSTVSSVELSSSIAGDSISSPSPPRISALATDSHGNHINVTIVLPPRDASSPWTFSEYSY
jgi:hypothetical protein